MGHTPIVLVCRARGQGGRGGHALGGNAVVKDAEVEGSGLLGAADAVVAAAPYDAAVERLHLEYGIVPHDLGAAVEP